MSETGDGRIRALERICDSEPADAALPALAELYRRAGRLADAERAAMRGLARDPASPAGRAVWLLVLLDAGRVGEARRHLERWAEAAVAACDDLGPPPVLLPEAEGPEADLSEGELERAFASARPELERMITPDSIAEEAALRADGLFAAYSPLEATPAFATRTMAELLERQGDARGAARIRAALDRARPAEAERAPAMPRAAAIATLERWLDNLRRLQP